MMDVRKLMSDEETSVAEKRLVKSEKRPPPSPAQTGICPHLIAVCPILQHAHHHNTTTPTIMNGGCFDVAISNEVDSRGITKWSIHLYKQFSDETIHKQTNGDIPLRTVFQCVGPPYHYTVEVREHQDVLHNPSHLHSIRVTGGIVDVDYDDADEALRVVPVDNTSDEYTSQIWVFDALDAMYDMELFPDDDFAEAHGLLCEMHQGVEDMDIDLAIDDLAI